MYTFHVFSNSEVRFLDHFSLETSVVYCYNSSSYVVIFVVKCYGFYLYQYSCCYLLFLHSEQLAKVNSFK